MTDRFLDLAEHNIARLNRWRNDHYAHTLIRVLRLAPNLHVAEALLRGETVPRSSVDPQWLKAYGL